MRKKSLIQSVFIAAALIGCTNENLVDSKDVKNVAKANFTLSEVKTGLPLDSAVIIVDGIKTSDTLTKGGVLQLKNIPVGTYTVHIRKSGYAELLYQFTIDMAATNEIPVANDYSENITMYPLAESNAVEGSVRVFDKNNQFISSDKVPVKLEFADSHLKEKVIYVNTNSSGTFSFKSLPAYAQARLSFLPYTASGNVYVNSDAKVIEVLKSATLKISEPFNYNYDAAALKLLNTSFITGSAVADTMPVKLIFSEAIDTTRSKSAISIVNGVDTYGTILKFNKDTLSLSPLGGRWSSGTNTIQFGSGIYSITGKAYATNVNFAVGRSGSLSSDLKLTLDSVGVLPVADTNKISELTSSFSIKWDKDASADSYVLYRKASDEKNFTVQSQVFDGDSTHGRINSGTIFASGKSYKYLLVGKNSEGVSVLDETKAIEIKDLTAPYTSSMSWSWASGSTNQYSGTVNSMNNLNDTTNYGNGANRSQYLMNVDTLNQNNVPNFADSNLVATISFSENMDVRVTPKFNGSYGSYLTPVWSWDPNVKNKAYIYLKYNVGKDVYTNVGTTNTFTLSLDLSGLKDLMGNAFAEKTRLNTYRNAYTQQWTSNGIRTWVIKPSYTNFNNQGL